MYYTIFYIRYCYFFYKNYIVFLFWGHQYHTFCISEYPGTSSYCDTAQSYSKIIRLLKYCSCQRTSGNRHNGILARLLNLDEHLFLWSFVVRFHQQFGCFKVFKNF